VTTPPLPRPAEDRFPQDEPGDGTEYFYGRVRFDELILKHLLSRDGVFLSAAHPELCLYQYAKTRERAMQLPLIARLMAEEFLGLARDLEEHIHEYYKESE
jgi:hypothetical protein